MLSLFPQLLDFQFFGSLMLRVALGIIFLVHGWQKLSGDKTQFAGWLETMKFKPGKFWAWLVTLVELVGGILLAIGLFVQPTVLILAIQFFVIIIWFKRGQKFVGGWEFDFLILFALLALLVLGPGAWAFDLPL